MKNFIKRRLGMGLTASDLFGKPKAKRFNYSSESNALILDQAVQDRAAIAETTYSSEVENLLIEEFIPKNNLARKFYCSVLLGKVNYLSSSRWSKYGIREAAVEIFEYESCGTGWEPRHDGTGIEFVDFINKLFVKYDVKLDRDNTDKDNDCIYSLIKYAKYLAENLDRAAKTEDDKQLLEIEEIAAESFRQIHNELRNESKSYRLIYALSPVIRYWNLLSRHQNTWRYLIFLIQSSTNWDDSPEDRIEFREVISKLMEHWEYIESRDNKMADPIKETTEYQYIDMANDSVLRAPKNWILLNEEESLDCRYASVLEIQNGESYNAPTFLYISNTPTRNLADEEKLEILRLAASSWEQMEDILTDKVELEYGSDGSLLNYKEWSSAPRPKFLTVHSIEEYLYSSYEDKAVIMPRDEKEVQ